MESKRQTGIVLSSLLALFIAAGCASSPGTGSGPAPQITGVLGTPSATTTIDGKQLPPPPLPFGGVIRELATNSKT